MTTTKNIFGILDLAYTAQTKNHSNFIPLLIGHSGIGKTSICKQWAKGRNMKVLYLRLSLMEGPELVGLPVTVEGRTTFALPDFWPTDLNQEVLIILEEINRCPALTMNSILQLLTERQIHTYHLPDTCTIVATINPENSDYKVNPMDIAIKNRFCSYSVNYNKNDFLAYIKAFKWDSHIISFIEEGHWVYKTPDELSETETYISSRSCEMIDALFIVGVSLSSKILKDTILELLGPIVGNSFITYLCPTVEVLNYKDFISKPEISTQKIITLFESSPLRFDVIEATKQSIINNIGKLNKDTMDRIDKTIGNKLDIRKLFWLDILVKYTKEKER